MASASNEIKICRATRRHLRYTLLWPKVDDDFKPGKNYTIRVALYILISIGFPISVLLHLINTTISINSPHGRINGYTRCTFSENIDIPVTEDIDGLASTCGMYYMALTYVKKQSKLAHLLKDLSNFNKFGKPPNFDEKEKTLNLISKIVFAYLVCSITQYSIVKFSQRHICEQRNLEKGLDEICGFILPVWTPFSTKNVYIYYSFYFYTFISIQILMKPSLLITFNAFEITQHLILKIKHLNQMLQNCFNYKDYNVSRIKLGRCISYHREIVRLVECLDECFSNGMLTHITITIVVCACIEKQFVEGDYICAATHLSAWIFTLVFACFSGQLLINASESIICAIWFSQWYEADIRLQKDILFMLAKSQRIFYLTAGPFNFLSLPLLVSVIKMSYSMLCILIS